MHPDDLFVPPNPVASACTGIAVAIPPRTSRAVTAVAGRQRHVLRSSMRRGPTHRGRFPATAGLPLRVHRAMNAGFAAGATAGSFGATCDGATSGTQPSSLQATTARGVNIKRQWGSKVAGRNHPRFWGENIMVPTKSRIKKLSERPESVSNTGNIYNTHNIGNTSNTVMIVSFVERSRSERP